MVLAPLLTLAALLTGPAAPGFEPGVVPPGRVVYPPGSGVVDVAGEYGAVPDDGRDDTAALQRALDEHPSGNHIFYLRDGVYDLSGTLRPAPAQGHSKRNVIQGESRDGTVLKLANGLTVDGEPFAGAVVDFNTANAAQNFRNGVRDLTVRTGVGNPRAIGLRFRASNRGAVRNVLVESGDGAGAVGLDLSSDLNGPLLVTNVEVRGFDVGVKAGGGHANSQTFERLTLTDQNEVAFLNPGWNMVAVRGLRTRGEVPAVVSRNGDPEGVLTLLDSRLEGVGAAAEHAAVELTSGFVRNVEATGFGAEVRRRFKSAGTGWQWRPSDEPLPPPGEAFVTAPGLRPPAAAPLFPDRPAAPFVLPVREPPAVARDAPAALWVDPRDHGGDPADGANGYEAENFAAQDDTAAVQAAVDACPPGGTVVLSGGAWVVAGEVVVRGGVRRVVGVNARVLGGGRFTVRDGDEGGPAVVEFADLECRGPGLHHGSDRTLVVRHCDFGLLTNDPGCGPIFLEDHIGWLRLDAATAWARQLNTEGAGGPHVDVRGGRLWVLGHKTERADATFVRSAAGAVAELYGVFTYLNNGETGLPWYVAEDATLTAVGRKVYGPGGRGPGQVTLLERWDRESRLGRATDAGALFPAGLFTAAPAAGAD
ncbi:glycosyl hydrolase family 28-related protein [Alienimonas sp. DA493]|uniref:glycosyl hydrolase family 28-related protein n=1 Tax=Alienimonas sp. DA493 TaxID=3373605 RepID=UPI0037552DD8